MKMIMWFGKLRRWVIGAFIALIVVDFILTAWFAGIIFPRASIRTVISLTGSPSYIADNTRTQGTVSFNMSPNSQGNLSITLYNSGTVHLHNVSMRIEQISDGLLLTKGQKEIQPPYTIFIGSLSRWSDASSGLKVSAPSQPGSYSFVLRILSSEVNYEFEIIILVN